MRRVWVIGGTGLVGTALADQLLDAGDEVHALLRRPSGRDDRSWHEHVAPPDSWPEIAAGRGGDVAISALGTTMRDAGSQAAFRAVDFDLVLRFAQATRSAGTNRFICVSSVGADPASASFYLRVKGELERALGQTGFERLDLIRPGLLRGQRGGERRVGERLGILVSPVVHLVLRGRLSRYAAIDGDTVAAAIAALIGKADPGTFVHHNRELIELASGGFKSPPQPAKAAPPQINGQSS
ncbi:MAG: NAD(P)H-binding protein [Allosphingosinicella sp.]